MPCSLKCAWYAIHSIGLESLNLSLSSAVSPYWNSSLSSSATWDDPLSCQPQPV